MKKIPSRTFGVSLTLAVWTAALTPALAADPVCKPLIAASQMLRTVPFHLYMTQTQSFPNQTMAQAAGQIGLGGTRQSEEISTGKDIYVLNRGQWIDMQTSFAAMEQDKDSDPDTVKSLEESRCKALPDETMYGQATRVYVRSTPGLNSEIKLWISKASNLPIRMDMTHDEGAMKMSTVSRYEYNSVQAPEHAMTMKDRVKSGTRR
jgi:endonuclease/exonuclease/phosphatase (EEP) superfamily protein YafD